MEALTQLIEPVEGLQRLLASFLSGSPSNEETKQKMVEMRDKLFKSARKAEAQLPRMELPPVLDTEINLREEIYDAFMTVVLTDISLAWGDVIIESNNYHSIIDVVADSLYTTFQCICSDTKSDGITDLISLSLFESDTSVAIIRSYLQRIRRPGNMKMGQSNHSEIKLLNDIKLIAKLPWILQTARQVCYSDSYRQTPNKRRRVTRDKSKDHYERNLWKIPLVYFLVTLNSDLQRLKREFVEIPIENVIQLVKKFTGLFPQLKNGVYEHTGITFFLLDSLISSSMDGDQDSTKSIFTGVTLERVSADLCYEQ
jgi:hypothetical protein